MNRPRLHKPDLSPAARARRKRYLMAVLVTVIAGSIVGGGVHVLMLGEGRLAQMRAKAAYDPRFEREHIRAAGEEAYLQLRNERGGAKSGYTLAEVKALLSPVEWKELDTMIRIPAGPFRMGSNDPRTNPENRPEHIVNLPAFWIDKYPVTNAQYARFVAATDHRPPLYWKNGKIPEGLAKHPVVMVSWYDARDYCRWAGKRLPTEAEWEKAARGTDGRLWPWGNQMDPNRLNTYYRFGHTTPVDMFPQGASPYGVMDMAGNVQEWTASVFVPYEGSDAPAEVFAVHGRTPDYQPGPGEDPKRLRYYVMRGGSWRSDPFSTKTYHRNYALPNQASDFFGFRCARDDVPAEGKR